MRVRVASMPRAFAIHGNAISPPELSIVIERVN
jgi:hypothetical protein